MHTPHVCNRLSGIVFLDRLHIWQFFYCFIYLAVPLTHNAKVLSYKFTQRIIPMSKSTQHISCTCFVVSGFNECDRKSLAAGEELTFLVQSEFLCFNLFCFHKYNFNHSTFNNFSWNNLFFTSTKLARKIFNELVAVSIWEFTLTLICAGLNIWIYNSTSFCDLISLVHAMHLILNFWNLWYYKAHQKNSSRTDRIGSSSAIILKFRDARYLSKFCTGLLPDSKNPKVQCKLKTFI